MEKMEIGKRLVFVFNWEYFNNNEYCLTCTIDKIDGNKTFISNNSIYSYVIIDNAFYDIRPNGDYTKRGKITDIKKVTYL